MKQKVEEIVEEIVLPLVNENLFELVEVEFIKEGSNWFLRIYIDKPGGVSLDDCQLISHAVSDKLDEVDPIKQSYFLEVSSPGLDRPIKKDSDFVKYSGQMVEVKLFKPKDGIKSFEGELHGTLDNKILIRIDDKIVEFEKQDVAKVKRVIKF